MRKYKCHYDKSIFINEKITSILNFRYEGGGSIIKLNYNV